jgi:murein DD-endopeptidase MepM/ murein hydrolase activator NlpD
MESFPRALSALSALCALVVGVAIGLLLTASRASALPVTVDGSVTPPVLAVTPPAPSGGGVWPLRPRPPVVAGFQPPESRYGSGHRGVDLAGRPGQLVRTALPGRVTYAGRLAGRGVVVVDHGDRRTTYEPVTSTVHVGDHLAAGAVIGHLELFGSHCFPRACLHWGLIEGRDHYLDPLTLVGAAPVRLLPLFGPLPAPSRSRVGLPVGLPQPVGGDVGVDLRRGQ